MRVQAERRSGHGARVAGQACRVTLMSNPAVGATSGLPSANSSIRANARGHSGASATAFAVIPWIDVLNGWNPPTPGGLTYVLNLSAIRPSRTRVMPTEQALSRDQLAFSKSIATHSAFTVPPR